MLNISPPRKIQKIFEFLKENHSINKKIQEDFLGLTLSPYKNNKDRAKLLLYRTVNTQSQINLDDARDFFQKLESKCSLETLSSFSHFISNEYKSGRSIFECLKNMPGWGDKTSALLIRNLALINNNQKLNSMFWSDIHNIKSERIKLPVDSVILKIFENWPDNRSTLNKFKSINEYLTEIGYADEDMLIWDDLWFWGFITQRSYPKEGRKIEWNEAKYWAIISAPKDKEAIRRVKMLARRFLKLF